MRLHEAKREKSCWRRWKVLSGENEEVNLKVVSTRKHFSQPQNDLNETRLQETETKEEIRF